MFNQLKKKFMSFWDIFKDNNEWNEKTIVGFLSFAVMSVTALADVVTGIMGQQLEVSDTIFNSLCNHHLGCIWHR